MKTEIVAVTEHDTVVIGRAAELLREGELVAFPTETVYGLGADARLDRAVRRIFAVKGRPPDRALICHVDGPKSAASLVVGWDDRAERLVEEFWPGPLTLVLPKRAEVSDAVTAGGPTVAVRSPAHPVALALIRALGAPIAAPSANRSARISPTKGEHVLADLDGEIPLILDAGPTPVGLESTVLDLSSARPKILRQGAVGAAAIEACLNTSVDTVAPKRTLKSVPVRLFEGAPPPEADLSRAGVLWLGREDGRGSIGIRMPTAADAYGQKLYEALRDAQTRGADTIWVEMPPDTMEWQPIVARLRALASEP